MLFILMYGPDCADLQMETEQGEPCETLTLMWEFNVGDLLWLWVGTSTFEGVPESDYILDVCGLEAEGVPTIETSWGAIKGLYR